jgi:hypothetical protein
MQEFHEYITSFAPPNAHLLLLLLKFIRYGLQAMMSYT